MNLAAARSKATPGTVERVAWLVGYLQKYGAITSGFATERIGIKIRTFRRDIDRLRSAGHRIFAEQQGDHWALIYRGFDPDYSELVRRRAA